MRNFSVKNPQTRSEKIERKERDVTSSRNSMAAFGTMTGLAIYFECSLVLTSFLAMMTMLLGSCWRNETRRLAELKARAIAGNYSSDSELSSNPSTPLSFNLSKKNNQRATSLQPRSFNV